MFYLRNPASEHSAFQPTGIPFFQPTGIPLSSLRAFRIPAFGHSAIQPSATAGSLGSGLYSREGGFVIQFLYISLAEGKWWSGWNLVLGRKTVQPCFASDKMLCHRQLRYPLEFISLHCLCSVDRRSPARRNIPSNFSIPCHVHVHCSAFPYAIATIPSMVILLIGLLKHLFSVRNKTYRSMFTIIISLCAIEAQYFFQNSALLFQRDYLVDSMRSRNTLTLGIYLMLGRHFMGPSQVFLHALFSLPNSLGPTNQAACLCTHSEISHLPSSRSKLSFNLNLTASLCRSMPLFIPILLLVNPPMQPTYPF